MPAALCGQGLNGRVGGGGGLDGGLQVFWVQTAEWSTSAASPMQQETEAKDQAPSVICRGGSSSNVNSHSPDCSQLCVFATGQTPSSVLHCHLANLANSNWAGKGILEKAVLSLGGEWSCQVDISTSVGR